MDTFYRHPEDRNKILYGEWVVYAHPDKGEIPARVEDIYAKSKRGENNLSNYYPDTSYTISKHKTPKYKESFRCKIFYHNLNTGVGKIATVDCGRIFPMTEEENKEMEIYLSRDFNKFPLIMNSELLKEAVKKSLKENSFQLL